MLDHFNSYNFFSYNIELIHLLLIRMITPTPTSSWDSSGPTDYVKDIPQAIVPHQGGPVDPENMSV